MSRYGYGLMLPAVLLVSIFHQDVDSQNTGPFHIRRTSSGWKASERPAFQVVWNSWTHDCEKNWGIRIDVEKYGMLQNREDNWMGNEITLFYTLGLYPHYDKKGQPVNGGLPQLGNITAHLDKVRLDINKSIPDTTFTGLGVIDWESWRPNWDRDRDSQLIYQKQSEQLVRSKHPTWSPSMIEKEAKTEFEAAARAYMEGTLKFVTQLRPGGRWGFYGFPRCYNNGGIQPNCSEKNMLLNDRLTWLFHGSSGIYPSAYLNSKMHNASAYVHGQLIESRRVRGHAKTPIYMYSAYRQNGDSFYTKALLDASILQASDMGVDGIVLWGPSEESDTKATCREIKNYLTSTLGPYVANILNRTSQCSQQKCGSRGRCVHVNTLEDVTRVLSSGYQKPGIMVTLMQAWREFSTWVYELVISKLFGDEVNVVCECYPGWTGELCEIEV